MSYFIVLQKWEANNRPQLSLSLLTYRKSPYPVPLPRSIFLSKDTRTMNSGGGFSPPNTISLLYALIKLKFFPAGLSAEAGWGNVSCAAGLPLSQVTKPLKMTMKILKETSEKTWIQVHIFEKNTFWSSFWTQVQEADYTWLYQLAIAPSHMALARQPTMLGPATLLQLSSCWYKHCSIHFCQK